MQENYLTALPVFNEVLSVESVLDEVVRFSPHVLVVDDGSTDGTSEKLLARDDVFLASHELNQGYGAALRTAFHYAIQHEFEYLITIDCDGQHEPQRIQQFVTACQNMGADIVSGSRYLKSFESDTPPPQQRRQINHAITQTLNEKLGLGLTDAFCGFKAYRVESLRRLDLRESGYAMPLELWVQAACHDLSVVEVAVPLIYLDESRSFGGKLDDAEIRIAYYHEVLNRSFAALPDNCPNLAGDRVG
ncbi:MAG: glycosyltransferase family 2 protein [Planctomycetota bacterium]|nr:glycosyltransferase family 2 protein [Planctomycetota bacterium]